MLALVTAIFSCPPPRNYTLKFDHVLSPPTMKWDLRPCTPSAPKFTLNVRAYVAIRRRDSVRAETHQTRFKNDRRFKNALAKCGGQNIRRITRLFWPAPRKRSCVRNLPGPSVTLMSGAPPRLALES